MRSVQLVVSPFVPIMRLQELFMSTEPNFTNINARKRVGKEILNTSHIIQSDVRDKPKKEMERGLPMSLMPSGTKHKL